VLPALAVAFAAGLPAGGRRPRWDAWAVVVAFVLIAGVMLALPVVCDSCVPTQVDRAPSAWWAIVPLAAAAMVALAGTRRAETWPGVPAAMVVVILAMTAWARPVLELERTDRIATAVREAQEAGRDVAQLRHYKGEFQFTGRLTHPIHSFGDPADLAEWAWAHPDGYLVVPWLPAAAASGQLTVFATPYRGRVTALWPVSEALREGLVATPPSTLAAAPVRASR